MKRLVMVVAALCAADVWAMPTKAELAKAQPIVTELMAPVMEAYKNAAAKDRLAAAVKVGDVSSEFAGAAETEAAKFLLLKGAVNFYARGEAYDKAADRVVALQETVKDVPPSVIAEITGKATGKISETKAPRLYAQYRAAKMKAQAAEEAKTLAGKLKKTNTVALQRRYAEALAISGDWKLAYSEFAKIGDAKITTAVEAEAAGKAKNAEAGEFWWTYTPAYADAEDFFKAHAATFFRQALAAGEVTGLKKNLLEQRLATVTVAAEPKQAGVADSTSVPAQQASNAVSSQKQPARGDQISIRLNTNEVIEFVYCPAGSFMMGKADDNDTNSCTRVHKVTITRPFWISKTKITNGQWEAFEKPNEKLAKNYKQDPQSKDKIRNLPVWRVSYNSATAFASHLNRRLKSKLPKDTIFRLPTEAEWEYALCAGCEDPDDPYVRYRDGAYAEKEAARTVVEIQESDAVKYNQPFAASWMLDKMKTHLRCPGTLKKPNKWGIYDMLGNGGEILLDTVMQLKSWNIDTHPIAWGKRLKYVEAETDPIHVHEGECVACVVRGVGRGTSNVFCGDWYYKEGHPTTTDFYNPSFRLVIGPDLVSEWKARQGKK